MYECVYAYVPLTNLNACSKFNISTRVPICQQIAGARLPLLPYGYGWQGESFKNKPLTTPRGERGRGDKNNTKIVVESTSVGVPELNCGIPHAG